MGDTARCLHAWRDARSPQSSARLPRDASVVSETNITPPRGFPSRGPQEDPALNQICALFSKKTPNPPKNHLTFMGPDLPPSNRLRAARSQRDTGAATAGEAQDAV